MDAQPFYWPADWPTNTRLAPPVPDSFIATFALKLQAGGERYLPLMKHVSDTGPIASLKMSDTELQSLLNTLDSQMSTPVEQMRRHQRIPCRRIGMVITVNQNGYESTFVIPVRNISRGGLCFLHRSMLHQGTRCHVWVRTPNKEWLKSWAKVVRSRQVEHGVCEIGVQFDNDVDISCFEGSAVTENHSQSRPDAHA